jgi:hypothetical protein
MIFDIHTCPGPGQEIVMIETTCNGDAWDLLQLLRNAGFEDTYIGNWEQYEDCVVFANKD